MSDIVLTIEQHNEIIKEHQSRIISEEKRRKIELSAFTFLIGLGLSGSFFAFDKQKYIAKFNAEREIYEKRCSIEIKNSQNIQERYRQKLDKLRSKKG